MTELTKVLEMLNNIQVKGVDNVVMMAQAMVSLSNYIAANSNTASSSDTDNE